MLSDTFSGSAKRWVIVEKEAQDEFDLFTDHRNLRYIFDPHSVSNSVPKYIADKLHRWSLLLMGYNYDNHDISGEDNVWADLLSRWGSSFKTVCAIRQVSLPLSPQLDESFVWPTFKEIEVAQSGASPPSTMSKLTGDSLWRDDEQRIWIPDDAAELQMRVSVVGHFGIAGHRGVATTVEKICGQSVWKGMNKDIELFVNPCLHCASSVGGPPQPRLLGEAMHAERPNELIHWDYLFMGDSETKDCYVLVIKDDASSLSGCSHAKSRTPTLYFGLMDWFTSFGVCRTWVSDQGTHFKNKTIESLQHAMGAHHHFTTARCPWANDSVEVVMRETLRRCRALLSEWRLQPRA
ncbi:hypothetical protein PHMEG_00035302 [Phytophthora megakarya]|uniref:Integrase catalytic domain-containing protein n=1 Tax=Phytophthora megakarya TaxID=4795 RepID=A0A225UPK1_9STRA|nr:hypothetical protein PHMEG_00035302 [Phytophthora megakarya]